MDPLTALGLASNVLSFVSFASGLIKGTLEISASTTGCTTDVGRLNLACEQLQSFCNGLQSCIEHAIPDTCVEDAVSNTFAAIKDLSRSCKVDADELLRITKTLRMKRGSNGKLDCFKIALKTAWKKSSIEELQARLSGTQGTMTLHICTLAQYCSHTQLTRLEDLQKHSLLLQADQTTAIRRISDGIHDLLRRVRPGIDAGRREQQLGHFTVGDVESLQEKLQSLSLSQLDVKKQQNIIESLTFESRQVRHSQIPAAHEKTFQWALMTKQGSSHGPNFANWLRKGDGIFWVSGKPGSGKSTLMKYIADSPVTALLLGEWARPCRVTIVSHYFWIAGTSMQKSQQGLLQTLLYDIFRQCPYLIEQTCKKRWENTEFADSWSLKELHEALQTVVAGENAGLKFCFIIDGLDEYSGDHEEHTRLCRTLKGLAKSRSVKLCLSSRPWNIFEEEFGLEYPKIYMQDLTRGDIENYASSQLKEHARWAAVSAKHSQGQWLISEIVAKSSGVFLWVFLVVKLLRQGLTNRDGFNDLRRRLDSFPSELEPFFKSILESVEPFYHSHMSTALQIGITSTESHLNFLIYHFHFQEYEDRDYAIKHPIRLMDEAEIEEIRSNTSWHLDSRTRGLLEVNSEDGTVTFLHRTVRDFLSTQELRDFLDTKADSSLEFVPIMSVLKAHIALIKISALPEEITRKSFGKFEVSNDRGDTRQQNFLRQVEQTMRCARQLESQMAGDARYHALVDELDRTLLCMLSENTSGNICKIMPAPWSTRTQAFSREQLVQFKLFDYLGSKLDTEPSFLKDIQMLPIVWFIATGDHKTNMQFHRGREFDFLVCLLRKGGLDPNAPDRFAGISSWNEVLAHICHWWHVEQKSTTRLLSFLLEEGVLELYLKAGADPGTQIVGSTLSPGISWTRAAATVYLELCFDVLDHTPPIQTHYLDLLSEFLQLSSDEVLKHVADEFCLILGFWDKKRLHRNFQFFSEVFSILQQSLEARRIGDADTLQSLRQTGEKIFPSSLVKPVDVATELRGKKRKQESRLDPRREIKVKWESQE